MFIVRPPKILTTPKAIAQEVGCQTRFYPNRKRRRLFDYNRDFFMCPVNPEDTRNAPAQYQNLFHFLTRDKYGQRLQLGRMGIPIPTTVGSHQQARTAFADRGNGTRYVVRPLRHSGGRGYRVTQDPVDFTPNLEYIAELYPKRREYRVIFVYGNPLITLRKKPNGEAKEKEIEEAPWNHGNSTFQTINDVAGSRLAQTDFYWRMAHNPLVRAAHILAIDILYNVKQAEPYVVLEFNACPGVDIETNRAKIVEAIRNRV